VGSFLFRPSLRLSPTILTTRTIHKMSESSKEMPPPPEKHRRIRYDLFRGHPNMDMLPQLEIQSIMSDLLQEGEKDSWKRYLNCGANEGDKQFRSALL